MLVKATVLEASTTLQTCSACVERFVAMMCPQQLLPNLRENAGIDTDLGLALRAAHKSEHASNQARQQ
jgi:hypothetical protein